MNKTGEKNIFISYEMGEYYVQKLVVKNNNKYCYIYTDHGGILGSAIQLKYTFVVIRYQLPCTIWHWCSALQCVHGNVDGAKETSLTAELSI